MTGNQTDNSFLKVPEQSLTTLSFCEPSSREVSAWIDGLPMVNLGETARQIYNATIEFNQLSISAQQRFELLELVREPLYFVSDALYQKYLQQSITLDDNQRKILNLIRALHIYLATGYKLVFLQAPSSRLKKKELQIKALHRCLSALQPILLQNYLLYTPASPKMWSEAHSLYQLAVEHGIAKETTKDTLSKYRPDSSVEEAYIRLLLVPCAQPQQLQNQEIRLISQGIQLWSQYVKLSTEGQEGSSYLINPNSDVPPVYRQLIKPEVWPNYLGLDSMPLIKRLHSAASNIAAGKEVTSAMIAIPDGMSLGLLQHLIYAWGRMKQRHFNRTPAQGNVQNAIGLSSVHFYLAGETPFNSFIYGNAQASQPFIGADSTRFQAQDTTAERSKFDRWAESFDAGHNLLPEFTKPESNSDTVQAPSQPSSKLHELYEAELINISPRGYCLQINNLPSAGIMTGEVIAIRDSRSQRWSVGIVRWLRQIADKRAHIGIELIAPNCRPCAIRVLNKTGEHGDFLRGLLVPEIKAIAQPLSVITARVPFQVGHKVGVIKESDEQKFQLIKRVLSTSSVNQFVLRGIKSPTVSKVEVPEEKEQSFENLWRSL